VKTASASYQGWKEGQRLAVASMLGSGLLAAGNVLLGLAGRSTSVVAAGVEFAGDVLASGVVLFGLVVASRPPDANHPYGHGRSETLAGLLVGLILSAAGVGICTRSLQQVSNIHPPPAFYTIWPLIGSIVVKGILSTVKFRAGRRIQSAALVADAWNDGVDILSALAALTALGLTLHDPPRFLPADHYGGFAVGLIVIFTGLLVVRDTSLQLMDTMPEEAFLRAIRDTAMALPGVLGIEKCHARKTGLQYHVDLHLEVAPTMTVQDSHELATRVRFHLRERLPAIADVLVHVEPFPGTLPPPGESSEPQP